MTNSEWRHIDSAPKDGTEIIIACWGADSHGETFTYWLEESFWRSKDGWCLTVERMRSHTGSFPATHWMPLPALVVSEKESSADDQHCPSGDCLPHLGHILKCLGCERFTHHWMPQIADRQAERAAERRASGWVWQP